MRGSKGSVNYLGQTVGKLKVVGEDRSTGRLYWECVCECGRELKVRHDALHRADGTRSCGCVRFRMAPGRGRKHGKYRTPENVTWNNMIARCTNPKNPAYKYYGGRGITVCDRWLHDFLSFLEDMGEKPTPGHTIERVDNEGPYAPWNCVWATMDKQANNKTDNRVITALGQTKTMTEWSKETGILVGTIWRRLELGWSDHDAVTKPVQHRDQSWRNAA